MISTLVDSNVLLDVLVEDPEWAPWSSNALENAADAKPVVFYNPRNFWDPLFKLFQHTVDEKLTPPEFMNAWVSVDRPEDVVAALLGQGRERYASEAAVGRRG